MLPSLSEDFSQNETCEAFWGLNEFLSFHHSESSGKDEKKVFSKMCLPVVVLSRVSLGMTYFYVAEFNKVSMEAKAHQTFLFSLWTEGEEEKYATTDQSGFTMNEVKESR